jgi:hypothetical protein
MENELRSAARNGLILRKDEASAHLAEARRHLEQAMNEAKGTATAPASGSQGSLHKDGEARRLGSCIKNGRCSWV